jgi:hypothetical protein
MFYSWKDSITYYTIRPGQLIYVLIRRKVKTETFRQELQKGQFYFGQTFSMEHHSSWKVVLRQENLHILFWGRRIQSPTSL